MAQGVEDLGVATYAHAHTEDEGTKGDEAHRAVSDFRRKKMKVAKEEPEDEESEDDETALHKRPPFT